MEPFDVAQSFVELCESEQLPASRLTAGFQNSIEALSFRYFAFCAHVDPLHPPANAIMIQNYPVAWVQRYSEERLYEVDPVLQLAECARLPFFWDPVFQTDSITAAQRKILVNGANVGIAHGFTIPLHFSWLLPGVPRASCSVVPGASTVARINYITVEIMATAMYTALHRVHLPGRETVQIQLSRRERQCLSLAALGKDDWAIAQLLGLSPETVHSYMKRLMGRLRVCKRAQAVAWALATRQISFGDVPTAR